MSYRTDIVPCKDLWTSEYNSLPLVVVISQVLVLLLAKIGVYLQKVLQCPRKHRAFSPKIRSQSLVVNRKSVV